MLRKVKKMSDFAFFPKYFKNLPFPELQIIHYHLDQRVNSWKILNRIAPYWYVYWNETPGAGLIFGGRKVELTPDRVVVIPPFTVYSTDSDQPFLHNFLYFQIIGKYKTAVGRETVLPAEEFIPLFQSPFTFPFYFSMTMYELVFHLLRNLPSDSFIKDSDKFDERIERVLNYISYHEKAECSNAALSRIACMSVSHFNHLFIRLIGCSPQQYVLSFFMEKARIILESQEGSIKKAAEISGFSNRYSFSHAYKKFFGTSPGRHQKSLNQNPENNLAYPIISCASRSGSRLKPK